MSPQLSVTGNDVNFVNANRIGGANHGRQVARLVKVFCENRQVRLAAVQDPVNLGASPSAHAPIMIQPDGRITRQERSIRNSDWTSNNAGSTRIKDLSR